MHFRTGLFVSSLFLLSAVSMAQLSAVGPFEGSLTEDFESYTDYTELGIRGTDELSIMGGFGQLTSDPVGSEQIWIWDELSAAWGLGSSGTASTKSFHQGLGFYDGGVPIHTVLTFNSAVSRWGTWYAADNSATTSLTFIDESGAQIDAVQFATTPNSNLVWIGWESQIGIKSIEFGGTTIAPAMDDMQADPVPEPCSLAMAAVLGFSALIRRKGRI